MTRREDKYWWRLFATGLSFVVFGIGGIILGYLVLPIVALASHPQNKRRRRCRYLVHLSFKAFAWFMKTLGVMRWEVRDREILRQEGCLVVANHPSLIDIVLLISLIPNATCIVKSAVYSNPFMRGPVSWTGYIPNHSPEQLIQDCIGELQKGSSLVIFPEGTRSVRGQPLRLKRGAAHIWLKVRCGVTLVSITVRPPVLAKHEKWHDVPALRPRFKLDVKPPRFVDNTQQYLRGNIAAKTITAKWKEYFTGEIKA